MQKSMGHKKAILKGKSTALSEQANKKKKTGKIPFY